MMNRRNFALATPALAMTGLVLAQTKAPKSAPATDRTTKAIVVGAIPSLHWGAYDVVTNVARNLPQIIEQNLCLMDGDKLASFLFRNMSAQELKTLAQVYTNRSSEVSRVSRLHDLLAVRLNGTQLGNASVAFGFEPIYAALNRVAPEKATQFLAHASPNNQAPTVGGTIQGAALLNGPAPTIYQSITDIYLEFRTAPVGSLGARAALYETAMFAGKRLSGHFGIGLTIGSGISWALQTWAPDLHMAIGGFVYDIFTPLFNSIGIGNSLETGMHQNSIALDFGLGGMTGIFSTGGGDYGIVNEWRQLSGGSGGGGGACNPYCDFDEN